MTDAPSWLREWLAQAMAVSDAITELPRALEVRCWWWMLSQSPGKA